MVKSAEIKNLATALVKFQKAMRPVKKGAQNPFFKSKYADLASIIEAVREPLAENGLSFAQFPAGEAGLTSILMHESGEWIEENYTMKPSGKEVKATDGTTRVVITPQDWGSAISYMRRYALSSMLGVATEDDDGSVASGLGKKVIFSPTPISPTPKGATGSENGKKINPAKPPFDKDPNNENNSIGDED